MPKLDLYVAYMEGDSNYFYKDFREKIDQVLDLKGIQGEWHEEKICFDTEFQVVTQTRSNLLCLPELTKTYSEKFRCSSPRSGRKSKSILFECDAVLSYPDNGAIMACVYKFESIHCEQDVD